MCASLVAQMIKNLPAMWETQVRSLGCQDPLEEGMETHSSILAWRIPGQRTLAGYGPQGRQSQTPLKRLSSSTSATWEGHARLHLVLDL